MEQVLEIADDRVVADDEQQVIELSTDLLGQIGGGGTGATGI
ncbi:MAG TPA: hypothetical protein VH278_02130 [Burkholderiaceae bacterium]|jgi:hypothetical protein|nr:hypothetical protein [Burkholderiaceae bacterium]